MYSYQDRIRAVELYIKLGKRVRVTIRQLGYPTKNALKGWFREYERSLDLPKGYLRPKPKYSQGQKETAVRHYLEHGKCVAATIRALGYPGRASLTAWVEELHPEFRVRLVGRAECVSHSAALKQAAVIALCTRQGSAEALVHPAHVDHSWFPCSNIEQGSVYTWVRFARSRPLQVGQF
jgi:putative transposase